MSNKMVMAAIALVVGAGAGFMIGKGEKEIVEVEKVVEATSTLDAVKAKGFVQCGVSQGLPGFSNADDSGKWTGIDVDLCRAVAAAVFGDAEKVKFSALSAKQRFTALSSGEIDILSRNTTWTMTRDTQLGLNFACLLYTSPSPRDRG